MARQDALAQVRTRNTVTPQREQADPRQVRNSAGGWTFEIPGETRVLRFLTIGVEGGTYYIKPRELVKSNAAVVLDWARNRPAGLVKLAAEISLAGRAPRNEPALFAVAAALALGDEAGREAAAQAVTQVARTGTHLFTFCGYMEQFRGWGRKAERAVSAWYLGRDADKLAYQLVKYRQRNGWSHADVLRMAHPDPHRDGALMAAHDTLFAWVTGRDVNLLAMPALVQAYERAREIERGTAATAQARSAAYVRLVQETPGLPWEALPDEATASGSVLGALVDAGMPQTALIRQLPKLTARGALPPMSARLRAACDQIRDPELLLRGRVHPLAVLIALKTYAAGRSIRGDSTWTPIPAVADALNDAFYAAFPAVEPAGRRTMLCTDTSGSMGWAIAGMPFRAVEIVGAMAMVTARSEPYWGIYGFASELFPIQISPQMRLDTVMRVMLDRWGGSTDCAAPMVWALKNRIEVDTFSVYTDNETWFGSVHPHEALRRYRDGMGIDARLQVIAVAPTDFSIADPDDPRQLDISGFDSAVPKLLADHSRGDI